MAEQTALSEAVQDIHGEEGAGIDADTAEQVVIDLSLLSYMKEKLASTSGLNSSPSFTICRVPANIRNCDHAAYDPRIVSIGPFHRGRENLQAMEENKWRYLREVLAYKPENNLDKFLKEMKAIEMRARDCYSGKIKMSSKDFVEMMVLDGCFLIFIFLHENDDSVQLDALIDDNEWMLPAIRLDMLLFENQLPFFVLECLWELIGLPKDKLWEWALNSFDYILSYELELKSPEEYGGIRHLLHLLHLSLKPGSPTGEPQTTSASGKLSSPCLCQHIGKTLRSLRPTYLINKCDRFRTPSQQSLSESRHTPRLRWNLIPSATELQEAGVRFHELTQARSFFDVRFERGRMKMSRLFIFDSVSILFRNFIALEQCFHRLGNHFTSYCRFIDFLVDTPRDVSLLREANIITNGLGSNEEVALIFNKLGKEIAWDVDNSYLADLFKEVNQHTQKRWPRWRAKLVRDYFGSPWAIISLTAAVIILILTFLQTNFSVLTYFNPPKP